MQQQALLFSTRGSESLAKKIADYYGEPLGNLKIVNFSDGEFQPAFEQSVRGSRVFLIGSTFQPTDNLMELLLMCDAAKRASADKITSVLPFFGFARQDRKEAPCDTIGNKYVAKFHNV